MYLTCEAKDCKICNFRWKSSCQNLLRKIGVKDAVGGENRVQKDVDSKFPAHPLSPFPCLHVDYFIGKEQKF